MRDWLQRIVRASCRWLLIALGFAVLWTVLEFRAYTAREQADRMLNGEGVTSPTWRAGDECRPSTSAERRHDARMADLLTRVPRRLADPKLGAAARYYAWSWQIRGAADRCPPAPAHYASVAAVLVPLGWPTVTTDRLDLELARWLPPNPALARNLAELAFAPQPVAHGPLKYDNRPFARMMLAEQGRIARPWGRLALAQIAPDTKLGTSAAALAAATLPREAAPRIARALAAMTEQANARRELIRGLSGGPHIAYQLRDSERLYELADALGTAGAAAEPHSAPLTVLFRRHFGSGSHFGLLPAEPTYLCAAAERIGGRAAAAARRAPACRTQALARGRGKR